MSRYPFPISRNSHAIEFGFAKGGVQGVSQLLAIATLLQAEFASAAHCADNCESDANRTVRDIPVGNFDVNQCKQQLSLMRMFFATPTSRYRTNLRTVTFVLQNLALNVQKLVLLTSILNEPTARALSEIQPALPLESNFFLRTTSLVCSLVKSMRERKAQPDVLAQLT